MNRILVLGGYGFFGQYISKELASKSDFQVIVAGRSLDKAQKLAAELACDAYEIDIRYGMEAALKNTVPDIVINTCGPFQAQNYDVADQCVDFGAHYIDLSDGREFVSGISALDSKAKAAGVLVISGASSVPCLTAALIEYYKKDVANIECLEYGITTAQRSTPGLATTRAILGYVGKPFSSRIGGKKKQIYGWQNFWVKKFGILGWRCFGNCNVPDLTLFPEIYPELKTIRFYAGLELHLVHVVLWLLSWLVRIRIVRRLDSFAPFLLKLAAKFNRFGSTNSGMFLKMSGTSTDGIAKAVTFELVAQSGHGSVIPCIPSIILCTKIARGEIASYRAQPCIGLISKQEYLAALSHLDISWNTTISTDS